MTFDEVSLITSGDEGRNDVQEDMGRMVGNREKESAAREVASFEQVFHDEQHKMFRVAYLLLGSEHQAEEAVQDAFARLLDRFDAVDNPGGFLRTATVNRCRDLLRRRRKENDLLSWMRREPPAQLETRVMDDVLRGLDHDRREVIVLRFYLGHTTAEIAQLLGIPEGTVRSRMQRGLVQLRGEVK